MIKGLSTSNSGLRFAQERLRFSAHNIANTTTMETVSLRTRGHGRLETRRRVEETAAMIAASQHFAAGVRAVQTLEEMLGATFDIEG